MVRNLRPSTPPLAVVYRTTAAGPRRCSRRSSRGGAFRPRPRERPWTGRLHAKVAAAAVMASKPQAVLLSPNGAPSGFMKAKPDDARVPIYALSLAARRPCSRSSAPGARDGLHAGRASPTRRTTALAHRSPPPWPRPTWRPPTIACGATSTPASWWKCSSAAARGRRGGNLAAIERMIDVDRGGFRLGSAARTTTARGSSRSPSSTQRQVSALTGDRPSAGCLDRGRTRVKCWNAGVYGRPRTSVKAGWRSWRQPGFPLCRLQPLSVLWPVRLPVGLRGGRYGRHQHRVLVLSAYPPPYAYRSLLDPLLFHYYPSPTTPLTTPRPSNWALLRLVGWWLAHGMVTGTGSGGRLRTGGGAEAGATVGQGAAAVGWLSTPLLASPAPRLIPSRRFSSARLRSQECRTVRRVGHDVEALAGHALAHVGRVHALDGGLVQSLDDRRRRAGGRGDGLPDSSRPAARRCSPRSGRPAAGPPVGRR